MIKIIVPILALASFVMSEESDNCSAKHGGSFFLSMGAVNMDIAPIKDLAENDKALRSYKYDLSNTLTTLNGLGFMWGNSDGVKGGFSLHGGYKRYRSESTSIALRDSGNVVIDNSSGKPVMVDSVMNLMVIPAYALFNFEKSKKLSNFTIYGGGGIGGGAIVLIRFGEEAAEGSAFRDDPLMSLDSSGGKIAERSSFAAAPLVVLDLHAGTSLSISKKFHIGVEGFMFGQYAEEGFLGAERGSFTQILPGMRIKFIFGSLG
ncbi:MAG: hypothetical protein JNL74_05995 [Fibrobacteres bacterium]|nr:hypothetical protein [Fibrobacterota bacterium]